MCVRKLPLQKSSTSSPATAPEKLVGGTVLVYEINEVNDRPVRKPQEKVLMNIAASFPSVKKPRYVNWERSKQMTEVMLASLR
jgi:hypothetical protein